MNHGITNQFYKPINNTYGNQSSSFKIKGTILMNNGLSLKLDIGNQKILDIRLKEKIDGNIGDTVVIDKKSILNSKLQQAVGSQLTKGEEDRYSQILKSFNLPSNNEQLHALKTLDTYGISITKDNILSFMASKNHLDTIVNDLDYNSAIKFIEEDIDIEKEPLEKVAQKLSEGNNDEKLTISKILKSINKLDTEKAEEISKGIYGNKMGKDITDVIKALYKSGLEISKNSIERVNQVFNKLKDIKGIDDEKLLDAIKNKIDISIDNLHKIKKSIVKGRVEAESRLSQYATRLYEGILPSKGITDKELKLMEEDIKAFLHREGLEASQENIRLSKLIIKQEIPLTKEALEGLNGTRASIEELTKLLTKDNAAILLRAGIDIEKENINNLLDKLKELISMEAQPGILEDDKLDLMEKVMDKVNKLTKLTEEELLALLKTNSQIKLSQIAGVDRGFRPLNEDKDLKQGLDSTIQIINIFNNVKSVDLNTIALHISRNMPLNLESIFINGRSYSGQGDGQMEGIPEKAARALEKHNLQVNSINTQRLIEIEGQYRHIRQSLTASMVRETVDKGLKPEILSLENLTSIIDKSTNNLTRDLSIMSQIKEQREGIIALLMKNGIPNNLAEVQRLSQLLSNRQNLGSQLQSLSDLIDNSNNTELKDSLSGFKNQMQQLEKGIKAADPNISKFNDDLLRFVRDIGSKGQLLEEGLKLKVDKQLERIVDTYQLQGQINKNDTFLQIPLLMNNNINNLQVFVMNKKKNSKKIDPANMSILMNLDTEHMDNINVYVAVSGKKVSVKIGVQKESYKKAIEGDVKALEKLIADLGYEIKEVGFKVDQHQHLLGMVDELEIDDLASSYSINITI